MYIDSLAISVLVQFITAGRVFGEVFGELFSDFWKICTNKSKEWR